MKGKHRILLPHNPNQPRSSQLRKTSKKRIICRKSKSLMTKELIKKIL